MILKPLYELLQKNVKFMWSHKCDMTFNKSREILTSDNVLVHYDPKLPNRIAVDASQYGVGAVISHVFENSEEKPIAYASQTLNSSQRNYSQIEKKAYAIVFGVKKFYLYLYGQKFLLVTDHKPLVTIFGPKTGIPLLTANRLQRWALMLST